MLAVETKRKRLFIGIPKESSLQENRIGLSPAAVKQLTEQGHEIWVETGAGEPSKYSDHDFSEAGAKIVYSTQEVYEADIILKIAPPTYDEMDYLKANQTLDLGFAVCQYYGRLRASFVPEKNKRHFVRADKRPFGNQTGGSGHERNCRQYGYADRGGIP
jgi:alanine dehydrogenase